MAEINKVIQVGNILTNLIDSQTGKSVNYRIVENYYDDTPMDDSKVDGDLYRKKDSLYLRKIIDKDGELFLEVPNVATLKSLSPKDVLFLKAGVYKGVNLQGYYTPGDTPNSIQYYISNTTSSEDGGSIFEVLDIKLEHIFVDRVDVKYYGLGQTSNIIEVDAVKNITDKFLNVLFSKGIYNINLNIGYAGGISLRSGHDIQIDSDTILQVVPNGHHTYTMFGIDNCDGVKIHGKGLIRGEKDQHTGTSGEWGMGISIRSSSNVEITGINVDNTWGDGIYLGKLAVGDTNTNIKITKFRIRDCSRQGISVITVNGLVIRDGEISGTNRTLPMCGIDIEPNHDTDIMKGIYIDNVITKDNVGGGIYIIMNTVGAGTGLVDITINKHYSYREVRAFQLSSRNEYYVRGKITYKDAYLEDSYYSSILHSNYYNRPDVDIINPTIVNPNTSNSNNDYGAGISVVRDQTQTDPGYPLVKPKIRIYNPTIIDNRATKLLRNGIYVRNRFNTSDVFDVAISNPTVIGNTQAPVAYMGNYNIKDEYNNNVLILSNGLQSYQSLASYSKLTNVNSTATSTVNVNPFPIGYSFNVEVESENTLTLNIPTASVNGGFVFKLGGKVFRTLSSSNIGSKLKLKSIDSVNNIWLIESITGNWISGMDTYDEDRLTGVVFGDNSYGSVNGAADIDSLNRSCFFRAEGGGETAVGIHVNHFNSPNFAWQIKAISYTDPMPKVRIKNNGVWSDWVTLNAPATTATRGVVNQATAVPNGSSVDTLLAALRTAGIIAT